MSRTLDDIEELVLPVAIGVGGLYVLWWTLSRTDQLFRSVDDLTGRVIDYDLPVFGEGDLIDRWTLNPQEAHSLINRGWNWVTTPIRWVIG